MNDVYTNIKLSGYTVLIKKRK